jgi:hypothetical protein
LKKKVSTLCFSLLHNPIIFFSSLCVFFYFSSLSLSLSLSRHEKKVKTQTLTSSTSPSDADKKETLQPKIKTQSPGNVNECFIFFTFLSPPPRELCDLSSWKFERKAQRATTSRRRTTASERIFCFSFNIISYNLISSLKNEEKIEKQEEE